MMDESHGASRPDSRSRVAWKRGWGSLTEEAPLGPVSARPPTAGTPSISAIISMRPGASQRCVIWPLRPVLLSFLTTPTRPPDTHLSPDCRHGTPATQATRPVLPGGRESQPPCTQHFPPRLLIPCLLPSSCGCLPRARLRSALPHEATADPPGGSPRTLRASPGPHCPRPASFPGAPHPALTPTKHPGPQGQPRYCPLHNQ